MMFPQACDLTVTRATVLPFDSQGSVLSNCDIVVRDGRIAAMGKGVAADTDPLATLDGRNLLVTPGLINAHTHSPEALRRGLADAAPLDDWLASVWAGLDSIEAAEIALAVRLCAAEMLHGGVTSVVDHFRQSPLGAAAIESAASAWAGSGLRATLALMVRDRGLPPWLRGTMPDRDAQLALCRSAIASLAGGDGRVKFAIGPSAPTRCTDALLTGCARLARCAGIALHMHCDETAKEAADARRLFGMTAVEHLARLDVLGPDLSLAHAVWVQDTDIERLARSETTVVHNPTSNLRLGSGRAPVERFLAAGVRVAVGSDGAASNDTQSVLEALKLAILLPRAATDERSLWPSVRDGLRMVTETPSLAFGMGAPRLEAGGVADLAAFDLRSMALLPANDLHCQFALAGASLRARHVIVAGKLILYDGEILSFDESETIDEARAFLKRRQAAQESR